MALLGDIVYVINAYGASTNRSGQGNTAAGVITFVSSDGVTVNALVIPDAETPYHVTGLTTTVTSNGPYYVITRTS